MTIARKILVDDTRSGTYHIVSRCVRRAFLAGGVYEHRRDWIATLIEELAGIFTVDVYGYSVMSSHYHLVLRTHPEQAATLDDLDVATRWTTLFPKRDKHGQPQLHTLPELQALIANPGWVETRRHHLGSLSWFMRIINERVARRANREDECTGHFWEGRFKSVPLLDQAAVMAAMVYVDLNPIRARMATRPEDSDFTAIQQRIAVRQAYRKATGLFDQAPKLASETLERLIGYSGRPVPTHDQDGLWIAPLHNCISDDSDRLRHRTPTVDEYLDLVDATGRIIVSGKRGAIPAHLQPILERLQIDVDSWIATMSSVGSFLGTAIGNAAARAAEALRRGCKWIVERTKLYRSGATLT